MNQRIYFSGVGEPDLWNSRFLTGVSKRMLGFLIWDTTPDLAQATWEWPENRWSDAANARVAYFSPSRVIFNQAEFQELYGWATL